MDSQYPSWAARCRFRIAVVVIRTGPPSRRTTQDAAATRSTGRDAVEQAAAEVTMRPASRAGPGHVYTQGLSTQATPIRRAPRAATVPSDALGVRARRSGRSWGWRRLGDTRATAQSHRDILLKKDPSEREKWATASD
jgi:hypothetical protein